MLMKKKTLLHYLPLAVILAVAGWFFFVKLGRNLFWDWDECLYGQYVKEMPRAGHYLTNIWNGYIDLQKPPLYTWLLQIPAGLLGRSEFSLRLLSAISGLGLIASVYIFCKKYFNLVIATLASLILLTAELVVIYSLRLNTDIVYTLFIFWAFWAWLESSKTPRFTYIAGLLFGISTMLKGIGSTQFLGALFLTLFIQPKKAHFVRYFKMLATFAIVIVPWHLLVYQRYGADFIRIYFYENIIQRGKYPIEFHRERWWFYFVLLFRELKPWIFAGIVFPLIFAFKIFKEKNLKKIFNNFLKVARKDHLLVTILLVILIPLAGLTRFHTRIAWYALPLYPFIAIYLAYNLEILLRFATRLLDRFVISRFSPNGKYISMTIISILMFVFLSRDGIMLLNNEVKPSQNERAISIRDTAIIKAKELPFSVMNYLVAFGERQAKEILPPTEQIDMTWVYGGHPCAVYYSDKQIKYYYEIEAFKKNIGKKNQLYLLHKDDREVLPAEPKTIHYENEEYLFFSY